MNGKVHRDLDLTIGGPWPFRGIIPCMEPLGYLGGEHHEPAIFELYSSL